MSYPVVPVNTRKLIEKEGRVRVRGTVSSNGI
jgi:hypothetical protein